MSNDFVIEDEFLGPGERMCLLRAARKQLLELSDELDRLERLPDSAASGPIQATQAEADCLSRAVNWLWLRRSGDVSIEVDSKGISM